MNIISLLKSKNTVSYLYAENTLRQGLEKMKAHGYTAIPVITDTGDYVGCISEGDFLWYLTNYPECDRKTMEHIFIRDIMREDWNPAVRIDISFDVLFDRIINQNFVPVVDDRNKFIGIITRRDIMCAFRDKLYSVQSN